MFSDFSFSSESNASSFSDSFSSNNQNSSSTPFTNENRNRNRTSSRNETRNRNISLFTGLQSSESHSTTDVNNSLRNRNASRTEFSNRHRIRTAASFSNNENNHSSNFSFNDLPSPITFESVTDGSESLNNFRNRNSSRNENVIGNGMAFVTDGTDQTNQDYLVSQLTSDFLTHSDYSNNNNSDFDSISSTFSYQSENSSNFLGSNENLNNNSVDNVNNLMEFVIDINNNIINFDNADLNNNINNSPLFHVADTISSVNSVFEHLDSDVSSYYNGGNNNGSQSSLNSGLSLSSNDNDTHQYSSAPRMTLFENNDFSNDDLFQ